MIDSHTHIQLAGYNDLELMAMSGVEKVVSCTVGSPSTIQGLFDEVNNLLNIYKNNAKNNGIELYVAVGIHPSNIPPDWKYGLPKIEEYLSYDGVVGIGEVGINSERPLEEDVFIEMVNMAKKYDLPVVVHTPFINREEIVKKEIRVIEKVGISEDLVVIDHINIDILKMVKEKNYHIGLTVREGRLRPENIYENLKEFEDGMLNSDLINLGPSDPLSLPKTLKFLRSKGVDKKILNKISYENAKKFFRKI